MYQLIQVRILYKLSKMSPEVRQSNRGLSKCLHKYLAIIVVALHLLAVSNFPIISPLNSLTSQVKEFEKSEGYRDKPGSVFLIENNVHKENWNRIVFNSYQAITK